MAIPVNGSLPIVNGTVVVIDSNFKQYISTVNAISGSSIQATSQVGGKIWYNVPYITNVQVGGALTQSLPPYWRTIQDQPGLKEII